MGRLLGSTVSVAQACPAAAPATIPGSWVVPSRREPSGAPATLSGMPPVTCHLRYEIDPSELDAFERFAKRWIALVERSGGRHHGYFLPSEGASDVAYALFTFPSLAAYEEYRQGFGRDPEFLAADRIREESGCVRRYERSFLRPLLDGDLGA
jgi:hypothetical protein